MSDVREDRKRLATDETVANDKADERSGQIGVREYVI